MNRSIRVLAISVLAAIAMLAAGVTWQQAVAGPGYRDDPRNLRTIEDRATRKRGRILTADGVLLARSERQGDGTYLRVYPEGSRYGHVTGYSAPQFPDLGIESARATDLLTRNTGSLESVLSRWLGIDLRPHDLLLTVRDDLQQVAADALGQQRGAVVALDPETGAVLALVSSPTFDPNEFVSAGFSGTRPGESSAIAKAYAPGSSFKVIVAAAGLESGEVTPETLLPDSRELELPDSTATIANFDGGFCGNGDTVSLEHAVVISCNTAFAALGMTLGAEAVVASAESAGFNRAIPFDLPTIASVIPEADTLDPAALAQTSLGQRDVRATPLQMALIAAGVANGGVVMKPFLVEADLDADGEIVESPDPAVFTRFTTAAAAADLAGMMEQAVLSGTGWRAAVPGLTVAGKTGTAEVPGGAPHVWFIGFASDPADPAAGSIALAVLVESGGERGDDGTGGSVAAPIAAAVLEVWREG